MSDILKLKPSAPEAQRQFSKYMRNVLLQSRNSVAAAIEKTYYVLELHVSISEKGIVIQRSRLFVVEELQGKQ